MNCKYISRSTIILLASYFDKLVFSPFSNYRNQFVYLAVNNKTYAVIIIYEVSY